jgi:hypothetical protein
MWQTCALLIALAAAAPASRHGPQPAEPERAFQCRTLAQPGARACVARCEAALGAPAEREARFECLTACTRRALHAAADCRRAGPPAAGPGDALAAVLRPAR